MRQGRGGPRFAAQALTVRRVAREMRRERLERDQASQPRIGRQIHAAHGSAAELASDLVMADESALLQPRIFFFEERRHAIDDGVDHEGAGARMMIEERGDFAAYRGIDAALVQPLLRIDGRFGERRLKHLAHLLPL